MADNFGSGFRIRVGTSGAKTLILSKRIGGRTANVTAGRFQDQRFTLIDARKKARTLLNDIEGGGDPRSDTLKKTRAGAGHLGAVRRIQEGKSQQAFDFRDRADLQQVCPAGSAIGWRIASPKQM